MDQPLDYPRHMRREDEADDGGALVCAGVFGIVGMIIGFVLALALIG